MDNDFADSELSPLSADDPQLEIPSGCSACNETDCEADEYESCPLRKKGSMVEQDEKQ